MKSNLFKTLAVSVFAFAAYAANAVYVIDNGTASGSIGLVAGGTISWANQFTAAAGENTISAVQIAWSRPASAGSGNMVPDGTPVLVQLWGDPNNDGNPSDAVLLSSVAGTTLNLGDTFISYNIPDVTLPVGSNFFVGATIAHAAGDFPASIDQSSAQGKSWINIGALPGAPFKIDDAGLPGNWMVRAEAVPEPATIAALSMGAIAMLRRRKK